MIGAGYTPLTQFSNGDYAGATQTQDDFAVIARTDRACSVTTTATAAQRRTALGEGD